MKKKAELLQEFNSQRKVVLDFLQAGNVEEAKKASDVLEQITKQLDEMPDVQAERMITKMDKKEKIVNLKRALNSFLHKGWKGLDDAERQLLKPANATDTPGQVEVTTSPSRGSVLVPVETADFVGTMDTGVYRLRTRVSEYFASTLSGNIPLMANPTAGLVAQFDEFPSGGISKGQVTFGNVAWAVKDYGLIVPVSNDLMADANADVMGVLSEQFFRAQVITENAMILAAIDANGAATAVHTWQEIADAVNACDPVDGADKVIITNTDGGSFLADQVDNNHYLLVQPNANDPKKYFRGYEVIQLPLAVLPNSVSDSSIPFYVGSLRDAVYFIERKGLEISYNPYSDSAYAKNAVDVRLTCRLDCKTKFASAVKKLAYTAPED